MKKIIKTMFISAIILSGKCSFSSSSSSSSETFSSEGSISNPVELNTNSSHSGQTDGYNSSYYVYYSPGGYAYYVTVSNMDEDVDLYVYNESSFNYYYNYSTQSGASNTESLWIYPDYYYYSGNLYIEVRPATNYGANYDIIVK